MERNRDEVFESIENIEELEVVEDDFDCKKNDKAGTLISLFDDSGDTTPLWNGRKSKPRVIFLDIDGVLNYEKWRIKEGYYSPKFHSTSVEPVDESKVKLVSKIIRKTKAKVVLSSSWRFILRKENPLYYEKGSRVYKVRMLFKKHHIKIYDRTGFDFVSPGNSIWGRGYEIQSYLDRHPEIRNYAIIDDAVIELRNFLDSPHYFQTFFDEEGLTEAQSEEIINYLNKTI